MAEEVAANHVSEDLGEDGDAEARPDELGLSGSRWALVVILPALLLGGGAAGAHFMGWLAPSPGKEPLHAEAEESERAVPAASLTYELPELQVSLSGGGGQSNLVKISVALEVEDEATIDRLHTTMPRVIDNFRVYLRELGIEDLSGPAGIERLGEELLLRVNASIRPARVLDVRFKEMLVK